MKKVQEEESVIDLEDASAINWLSEKGVDDALTYYGEDSLELKAFDYHDKVVLLCTHFKPNDV